jgi:hypothetical protein
MIRKITTIVLSILLTASVLSVGFTRGQERSVPNPTREGRPVLAGDNAGETDQTSSETSRQQKLFSSEEIEGLIENLANGQPLVIKTRMFSSGDLIEVNQRTIEVQRANAVFDLESKSLVVKGQLDNEPVIEDIRFLEFQDKFYVLRDIYPDNGEVDFSLGRGTPVSLDEVESQGASTDWQSVQAAAAAAPVIAEITGATNNASGITKGRVDMSCGGTYNGYYVVNDQTGSYHWIILGSNFGTTPGRVTLAGRVAPIAANGWSPTRIEVSPTVPYNWGPMSTSLTISTSNGTINKGVSIVPAVRTRIFGQCTWHVAVTRLNMGKQPSSSAYGGYSSITSSYVPQRGDQLQFSGSGGKHAAIITGVGGPTQSGGITKWTLTVSEVNYDCKNSLRTYITTFETRYGQVYQYPRSSIANYSASTSFYR